MRRLKLKAKPKIVTTNTKVDRREKGRERKALVAAQLDRAIENELLERLKQVSEGEVYNYPEKLYNSALSKASAGVEQEDDEDELEDEEEDEEGNVKARDGRIVHENEDEDEDDDDDGQYSVEFVEVFFS